MKIKLEKFVVYFIFYSFLGWLIETGIYWIHLQQFVNRGFLYMPILPIYGVGALLVSSIFTHSDYNAVIIGLIGGVVCGVVEYCSGLILKVFFDLQLWNYKDEFLNINGLVCFKSVGLFAVGSILIVKVINPYINRKIQKYQGTTKLEIILSIIVIIIFIDFIISLFKHSNIFIFLI